MNQKMKVVNWKQINEEETTENKINELLIEVNDLQRNETKKNNNLNNIKNTNWNVEKGTQWNR